MASPINHHERARRAFAAGQYAAAVESAEKVIARTRGDAVLLYILGTSLTNLSDPDRALPYLLEAQTISPRTPDILASLATVYRLLDRVEDALDTCDRALAIQADFEPAIVIKSTILRTTGQAQEALAFVEPCFREQPDQASLAGEFADVCLALGDHEAGIDALEPLAPRAKAADPRRRTPVARSVLYKLALLYDRVARYDDAFAAASEANRGREARVLTAAQLKHRWSSASLESIPIATVRGVTPILVVGMPRSGTTLAERIIATHPSGAGVGETRGLPNIARAQSELKRTPTPAWMDANARQYLDMLAGADPAAACVVDKLPGNFVNIGLASRLMPDLRIIHCTRDPRDACLSCYLQDFPETLAFTTDLAACAMQQLEKDAIMAYWQEALEVPTFELNYERLVHEPECTARELLEFLDLPWDDRVLAFHQHAGHVRTASWNQVTRPLNASSIGRWKAYEQHLKPMLDALERGGR